ncbi:SDR family oxidoreductase [Micromonospora sp. WMMA1363]|uniref:SDR family oxidoreductase n=1 Tax=Micromonospora sp. WMMA1363 TaxID=3053985 RepID=UPI00259CFBBB|nr:SDR family oxidoreductase [Micromonospora sp. WMMA1363]MDM4719380.1 SDR family oxidoreductase [Micromonospora sp. WMMA1363]
MDALDFGGRSVVVTGGTRGIGAGIARGFLAAGAQVLVCGRREPAELPRVDGRAARFAALDVRDPEQAGRLVALAVEVAGRLDVVVNNAGGAPSVRAADASPRLHAKVIELNLVAPLHVAQAANAVMQGQRHGGVILMVGSVSGVRPSPGAAAYGAAKAGLHHLVASLAMEWAPKVRVNTVVVGPAQTEVSNPHYGGSRGAAAVARTIPMGRLALPRDVADACLFLASPLSSYVSGAALALHGGGEWPGYLAAVTGSAYPADK